VRHRAGSAARTALAFGVALAMFLGESGLSTAADPEGQVAVVATGGVTPGFPVTNVDAIVTGPDGNIWFTIPFAAIGRLNPDGSVSVFDAGITSESIRHITVGPDGNLWFTEFNSPQAVAKITTGGSITEVVRSGENGFPTGNVQGIATGPDGNIWVTRPFGGADDTGAIDRITPAGAFTEFEADYAIETEPREITSGPDGNIWFTDSVGAIVKVDPASGNMTVVATAGVTAGFSADAGPSRITTGPDGNLWFIEQGLGRVARITVDGVVTEFSDGITPGAFLADLTGACDGNIWVGQGQEDESESQMLRVTPAGVITSFTNGIPSGSNIAGVARGPDDNVWFTGLSEPGRLMKIGTGCGGPTPIEPTAAPIEPLLAPIEITPTFTG
jgi:streptogramin lyase